MGGKKKKDTSKQPQIIPNSMEYDLKQSFSRLNRYRGSNPYQTQGAEEQESYNPPVDNSFSQGLEYTTDTNMFGQTYFRLEDKISALDDKNDAAHDSLRKELEEKIEKVRTDLGEEIKRKKDNKKWIIGLVTAIVVAIIGYVILPYQKASDNQKEIIKIETTIDENLKPSIENNSKAIENNALEIKNNTENLIQLQNQQKKK